jgi:hypothetical protein
LLSPEDTLAQLGVREVAPIDPPAKSRASLRFTMFRDISASPRKNWLIEGLIGSREVSALAGAPGSGKSVLAGDISCHTAAGRNWMDHRIRRPAGVLYVAAERAKLTERRFAAWRKYHEISELPLAVVEGSVDFLSSRSHVDEVVGLGRRLTKETRTPLGLIVVDTVSRTMAGGDENGPKDMGLFVANIAALQHASGAHVMLIHHIPQDGVTRLRGHGALLGAVDTLVTIEKSGETRFATVAKDNDGAEGARHAFSLHSVELSVDEDGLATNAPVVVSAQHEPQSLTTTTRRPVQLTAGATVALKALDKALAEVGESAPTSNHVPTTARVVTIDRWRDYAVKMGISTGEGRAQRKAFQDAVTRLSAAKLVGVWEPYVWRNNTS